MEVVDEENSSESNISHITDYTNDSSFIFNSDEFISIQKPEDLHPKIISISGILNLNCAINLKLISQKIKSSEYDQIILNKALIIKLKNITINIYQNGKIILTGAKSEKEAKKFFIKITKNIKKISSKEIKKEFKIQNIVSSYNINFRLNLEILFEELKELIDCDKNNCTFVRNNFHMVILNINNINEQKIIITFFESGKIVITGVNKINDIENIFKKVYPLLIKAKINNNNFE